MDTGNIIAIQLYLKEITRLPFQSEYEEYTFYKEVRNIEEELIEYEINDIFQKFQKIEDTILLERMIAYRPELFSKIQNIQKVLLYFTPECFKVIMTYASKKWSFAELNNLENSLDGVSSLLAYIGSYYDNKVFLDIIRDCYNNQEQLEELMK